MHIWHTGPDHHSAAIPSRSKQACSSAFESSDIRSWLFCHHIPDCRECICKEKKTKVSHSDTFCTKKHIPPSCNDWSQVLWFDCQLASCMRKRNQKISKAGWMPVVAIMTLRSSLSLADPFNPTISRPGLKDMEKTDQELL